MSDQRVNIIVSCLFPYDHEGRPFRHPVFGALWEDVGVWAENFQEKLEKIAEDRGARLRGSWGQELDSAIYADYLIASAPVDLTRVFHSLEFVQSRIPDHEIFDSGLELLLVSADRIQVLHGEVMIDWYAPFHGEQVEDLFTDFCRKLTTWADQRLQSCHRVGVRDCMIRGRFTSKVTSLPDHSLNFDQLEKCLAEAICEIPSEW